MIVAREKDGKTHLQVGSMLRTLCGLSLKVSDLESTTDEPDDTPTCEDCLALDAILWEPGVKLPLMRQ